MATKTCTWESFIPDLLPYISSADVKNFRRIPDAMLVHTIRSASIEFLREASLLRDTYCLDLQCGVNTVPVIVPDDREVMAIHKVTLQGEPTREYSFDPESNMLTFSQPVHEDVQNGYCVTYSYLPVDIDTCDAPPIICTHKWRRAIRDFTLRDLYGMNNMDWADKGYHSRYSMLAQQWISKGKGFASGGGVPKRKRLSTASKNLFWQ